MKKMLTKILSCLMIILLLTPVLFSAVPVHAGWKCEYCDQWWDETPAICFNCAIGECCADICPYCLACELCACELGFHCQECGETCVDPEFSDNPHCVECGRCENCVTLYETTNGLMCEECIELGESEGLILCPNCEINPIGHELESDEIVGNYSVGECGEHCSECYEAYYCPECSECSLCKGVDFCTTCEICEECAVSNGYHCPECDACYAEVGQCPDEGEHCINCCKDICEHCGKCTLATEDEYCETCHLCKDCWDHCEICEECYEDTEKCADDGNHCVDCCYSEGWICDGCGHCTEALEIEFCDLCGLCENCCRENSEYYGLDKCILDESTDVDEINPKLHDKNHHILKYTCSSDECHDVFCIYPGCDYYLSDCTPHEYKWKIIEKAAIGKDGKRKGICIYCGDEKEETIPKINPPTYYFIEIPEKVEAMSISSFVSFDVKIGVKENTETTKYAGISIIPYTAGDELSKTWGELKQNVYSMNCIGGRGSNTNDGEYTILVHKESNYAMNYGGKYAGMVAQGQKLSWKLAIHDVRAGDDGEVVYSKDFIIDWNAKHNQHKFSYVCGTYDPKSPLHWIKDGVDDINRYDGTYHWIKCDLCGYTTGIYSTHRYTLVSEEGTCQKVTRHYQCIDCGHKFDQTLNLSSDKFHAWSHEYFRASEYHYKKCAYCNLVKDKEKHDFEKTIVTKNCEKTIIAYVCKTCGYTHLEHDSGSGHKYTDDGDFNGWYGDSSDHWRICTKCGYVQKQGHQFVGGACKVCGYDIPQLAIIGTPCSHCGEARIELKSDINAADKAKFLDGKYSVTWIDEDTGETLGLGKTYEITPEDEGRHLLAEVMIMGGESYHAYTEWPIKTTYHTVQGYDATCASEGLKTHSVCDGCGKKFINGKEVNDVIIPKTNTHTYDNACDTTCNICGYERKITHKWSTQYSFTENGHCKECVVCGFTTDFEPHDLITTILKSPSCTEDGLCNKKCVCGYNEDAFIPAFEHKLEYAEAVPATCVSQGIIEHYCCSGCGHLYKDAAGTETVGFKKLLIPIDNNNHVGGDKIGYNIKEHYTVCECGAYINVEDHKFENNRCTVCGYKQSSNAKAGGKTLTHVDKVNATCVSTGVKEHYVDSEGKKYLSKTGLVEATDATLMLPIDAENHVSKEYKYSDTQHWIDCACGVQINLGDHQYSEAEKCTVCGYVKGSEIPAESTPVDSSEVNEDGKNKWLIGLLVGIVIALMIALIVFLVIVSIRNTRKKQKEQSAQQ